MALVAASRSGRVGGSAITIAVFGRTIGGAESITISVGDCGGAGTKVFLGFVGIRTRNALDTFDCIEETALMSSAIFLSFIFLLPSNLRLASLAC